MVLAKTNPEVEEEVFKEFFQLLAQAFTMFFLNARKFRELELPAQKLANTMVLDFKAFSAVAMETVPELAGCQAHYMKFHEACQDALAQLLQPTLTLQQEFETQMARNQKDRAERILLALNLRKNDKPAKELVAKFRKMFGL